MKEIEGEGDALGGGDEDLAMEDSRIGGETAFASFSGHSLLASCVSSPSRLGALSGGGEGEGGSSSPFGEEGLPLPMESISTNDQVLFSSSFSLFPFLIFFFFF